MAAGNKTDGPHSGWPSEMGAALLCSPEITTVLGMPSRKCHGARRDIFQCKIKKINAAVEGIIRAKLSVKRRELPVALPSRLNDLIKSKIP